MKTEKYYYKEMLAARLSANVVEVLLDQHAIVLDRTIAYPEGGGQLSDQGVIRWQGHEHEHEHEQKVRFIDAQKKGGYPLFQDDFPAINVNTKVLHMIHPDDQPLLEQLQAGDTVEISIDIERREQLSLSHTAAHVVYMALERIRPELVAGLIGCSIRPEGARFDFLVDERIYPEEVAEFEQCCQQLVEADHAVHLFNVEGQDEAWYWQADDCTMPCGGTHLASIGPIGRIELSRKRLGKGKERLNIRFPEAQYNYDKYQGV